MRKIFIACGREKQGFNRLLQELDRLVEQGNLKADLFAQTGASTYKPRNFVSKPFLLEEEFVSKISEASWVIGDASEEVVVPCLSFEKPCIVVPRLPRFHETGSDKQLALARALDNKGKALLVENIAELEVKLEELKQFVPWISSEKARLIIRLVLFFQAVKSR